MKEFVKMHDYPSTGEPLNIFATLRKESRALEIFHQGFLASLLSNTATRYIHDGFMDLLDAEWKSNAFNMDVSIFKREQPTIKTEVVLKDEQTTEDTESEPNNISSRADILLNYQECKTIIAIELKVEDESTTKGQLITYQNLLRVKYPEYQIIMVYLTPYNEKNKPNGKKYKIIHAINEYNEFIVQNQDHPQCHCHLNWGQIVEKYRVENGDLLFQHQEYVTDYMCNPERIIIDSKYPLKNYVGQEIVEKFIIGVNQAGLVHEGNYTYFPLDQNQHKYHELVDVLSILFDGEGIKRNKVSNDKIEQELKDKYLAENRFSPFFKLIFDEIDSRKFVFMKGEGRIGVRVSHEKANSTSLFQITPTGIELKSISDE